MQLSIRLATTADADDLNQIMWAADAAFVDVGHPELDDGRPIPDDALARATNEGRVAIAEIAQGGGPQPVGWILVYGGTDDDSEFGIGQVSVLPQWQERGVGSQLIGWAEHQAHRRKHSSIVLNTQSDVPWNQPFYERRGFEPVSRDDWTAEMHRIAAEQMTDGLDWTTRVHMRKKL